MIGAPGMLVGPTAAVPLAQVTQTLYVHGVGIKKSSKRSEDRPASALRRLFRGSDRLGGSPGR